MAAYRSVFKTWRDIYKGAFFAKILNGFKLLTIFEKTAPNSLCSTGLKIGVFLRVCLANNLFLFQVYKLSQENTQPKNMCDIVFEKKVMVGQETERVFMQKQPS